ncbi:GNAT family N-acetyltransferase [bacterium]|nr:GNAT family N-acetyltransferase [bacterium]
MPTSPNHGEFIRISSRDKTLLREVSIIEREAFGMQGLTFEQLVLFSHSGKIFGLEESEKLTAEAIVFQKFNKNSIFLFSFAVIEGKRRCGRGTHLMRSLCDYLSSRSFKRLELTVDPSNVPALDFYISHLRFQKKRFIPDHLGEGTHRILLEKFL